MTIDHTLVIPRMAESEAPRSPTEHFGRIIRGVGGVASGSGPGAFLSEILKKIRSQANRGRRRRNFEEWSRHRRAGPSHADIAILF
jgi:hypothetical protein